MIEFNDLNALEDALKHHDVAVVLAEPAMTNVGIILPDDGYWKAARELTYRYGTLLIADEDHGIGAILLDRPPQRLNGFLGVAMATSHHFSARRLSSAPGARSATAPKLR